MLDAILARGFLPSLPLVADCHVELASGKEFDYLWVPNYDNAEFCRIRMDCSAELVFGEGKLEIGSGEVILKHARQAVLRLRKEREA